MRFRRSIKLAPGIRMNLSGSGLSWSLGPRGASVSFGKRGAYLNSSIPGTGLYSRSRLDSPAPRAPPAQPTTVMVSARVTVSDDGVVSFLDADGQPLSDYLIGRAKAQQGDTIRDMLAGACDKINATADAVGEIHRYTPSPDVAPTYELQQFGEPRPTEPPMKAIDFLARIFKGRRQRIEQENATRAAEHAAAVQQWEQQKAAFDQQQRDRQRFTEHDIRHDVAAMEGWLEENLSAIDWPRETLVSFDLSSDGTTASIDVDLPEIEDMPTKTASLPARGYKLSLKQMSTTTVQRLYMRHVHGVGFRIIGEAFADLPALREVVLSAYSQRTHAATAQVRDEYLYSVRVTRDKWQRIDFGNLEALDVVEALAAFDLRREMTKTGKFKAVQPMSATASG